MAPPGSPRPGSEATQPVFHPSYIFQMLDTLYRDNTSLRVGDRVAYGDATIEVTEVTGDGRPAEVAFRFEVDLEDPTLRWLQWHEGVYVPYVPPAVGETEILPSVVLPW